MSNALKGSYQHVCSDFCERRSQSELAMKRFHFSVSIACCVIALSVTLGCDRDTKSSASTAPGAAGQKGLTKIRVGTIGLTCEAPLSSAYENGFFKEEGLEVEFVRCQ